jgi:hypothetical protein
MVSHILVLPLIGLKLPLVANWIWSLRNRRLQNKSWSLPWCLKEQRREHRWILMMTWRMVSLYDFSIRRQFLLVWNTEPFDMTFEINDVAKGIGVNLTLSSMTLWQDLCHKVAHVLNMFLDSLHPNTVSAMSKRGHSHSIWTLPNLTRRCAINLNLLSFQRFCRMDSDPSGRGD